MLSKWGEIKIVQQVKEVADSYVHCYPGYLPEKFDFTVFLFELL